MRACMQMKPERACMSSSLHHFDRKPCICMLHACMVHHSSTVFQIQGQQVPYVKVTCICVHDRMAPMQHKQGSYHGTLLYASFIAANRHTWRMQRPDDPFLFPSFYSVQCCCVDRSISAGANYMRKLILLRKREVKMKNKR